ncbi:MAG: S8 family serine peptidase [Ardenticatenaceae bacterium]|nr:S8 family serine peptidase [Ardenticatenaceae bacterium]MCB9443269.1 S8 family serine peptidase [Ardenticatenaceae bacterium]
MNKSPIRRLGMIILLILLVAVPMTAVAGVNNEAQVRVYVEYAAGHKDAAHNALARAGAQFHHEFAQLNSFAVTLPEAALKGIAHNPNVVSVEPDAPRYLAGPAAGVSAAAQLQTLAQVVPYGVTAVQAPEVWAEGYNGANRKVCIIDTGYYPGHEDLPDDVDGVSQIDGELFTDDGNSHGSHVAGTIVGIDNEIGVVGVAPGVDLFIVKIFDFDGLWVSKAHSSDLVAAAYACEEAGANVISMSLSGTQANSKEESAFAGLYERGILSIGAASNDGIEEYHYPASYPSVVSVAAVDSDNVVADFSQFNDAVELAAPGVEVLSTTSYKATDDVTVDGSTYAARGVEYSVYGTATGLLADGALCTTTGDWAGQVVLCERGDISFYDKVMNVQNSGGIAVVIYNNEPGNFWATLGDGNSSDIPAINISQEDGQLLAANAIGLESVVRHLWDYPASGYEAWDGTSMATPHVSAVAALIWSANPAWSNEAIRLAMQETALDLGDPGRDVHYGFGLVQARDALDLLQASSGTAMHAAGIDMSYTLQGKNFNLYTAVTIVDEFGVPVTGADVALTIETPGGSLVADSGVTDDSGIITFRLRTRQPGRYEATITGVTHAELEYQPDANAETSASLTIVR